MTRNTSLLAALGLLLGLPASAQMGFTQHPEILPMATASGNCMAATDMNDDGRDDLCIMDYSTHVRVFYQNVDGKYVPYDYGSVSSSNQWGMAVTDFDNDGHKDVLSGGSYDGVHYLRIASPGATPVSIAVPSYIFMQCTSAADIDNNGWVDGFGCHDDGPPAIWMNDATGNLTEQYVMDFTTNPISDASGNYGSVFTDFDNDGDIDLYIAHCRQGVNNPADPRRWDRLFVNDGTNHYTDQALAYGVQNPWQTWCVDFGDWDNDGDEDLVALDHDNYMQLFTNDGTGHFTEISDGGLMMAGFFLEVHMEDFDNDGFLDILIGGGSHALLQGHGDGSFTNVTAALPTTGIMHSFAVADLNDDGAMDIWSSYGSGYTQPNPSMPDMPLLNNGNDNHWLNVKLRGVSSNSDAIGARVTLTTALGTQIREVRAGESYGLTNTAICHFGLGANTTIQTLSVHWPSGLVDTYSNVDADQSLTLLEGVCIAPTVDITSSSLALCPNGDPLTLTSATEAAGYLWSTGATSPSIDIAEPGVYTLKIHTENPDCVAQTAIFISNTGGEDPVITANGPTALCPGGHVTLTSTQADSYTWSNSATSQSITVDSPGTYSVSVTDGCPDLPSNTIEVTALPAPDPATASDVSIPTPGTAELTASDATVNWYDAASDGNLVGTGSPWTTPFLNTNTTFWCAVPSPVVPETVYAGITDHGPNSQVENFDTFFPVFTADAHFVIRSVKVYASIPQTCAVALVQWPSGTVVTLGNYTVPAGESRIQLDYDVTPGTYGLRCIGAFQLSYEYITSGYPFPIGDVGEIIGACAGTMGVTSAQYYEIFYDWEVDATSQGCESARTPVQVLVGSTGINEATASDVRVYPVPATEQLTIAFGTISGPVDADLLDITGRLVRSARLMAGANEQRMDISGLAAGEYTLRLRHANGTVVRHVQVR